MSISYLASIQQLSVLAHFCGLDGFPMLPELPFIEKDQCEAILEELRQGGAVQIHDGEICPDISLSFVLSAMAAPALIIQVDNALGYCTKNLLVAVSKDSYLSGKYKITPLPRAEDLAITLAAGKTKGSGYLVHSASETKTGEFSNAELVSIISQVYTEV